MTNQTHTTLPTKKTVAEHQKRVSAMAVGGEEEEKHILANRYKTKMCKNFVAKGECPYEVRCMFAHGEQELRTSEDNIRDGLVTEEAIKAFQRQQNQTKRRSTYAAAREAEARAAAQQMYRESEDNSAEAAYYQHDHHHQHEHETANAPRFIPQAQSRQHVAGYFIHNPYAFSILPAEGREFAVYEAEPEETAAYWYETPVDEDYYFPSSDMMAPLVPSVVAQPHQQQYYHAANSKMYDSVNTSSFNDEATYGQSESSDYTAYAPQGHCTAAEMPNFSEEAPIVLEP